MSVATGIGGEALGQDGGGVLPRALGVDRDLDRAAPGQTGEPGAQRLGGRQIADADDELRDAPCGEPGVAEEQVVARHRRRSVPRAGEWVGEQGVPGALGEPGDRRAEIAITLVAPRDDDAPGGQLRRHRGGGGRGGPGGGDDRGGPGAGGDRGGPGAGGDRGGPGGRRALHPRATARAAGRVRLRQWLGQDQWLPEREVQVHGTGPDPERRPVRAAGEVADPAEVRGGGLVDADLDEPPDGVAVELELVDGLAGADVAQLWRPIGGQDDQRNPGLVGFDHRRGEVRDG